MAKAKKSMVEKVYDLLIKHQNVSISRLKYATKEASNNYYYLRCLQFLRTKGFKIKKTTDGLYTLKNK